MSKKGIVITIRPEHYCNILNGIKKGELRVNQSLKKAIECVNQRFGECVIYAYCSIAVGSNDFLYFDKDLDKYVRGRKSDDVINGRIKFCFKARALLNVDEKDGRFVTDEMTEDEVLDFVCLDKKRLADYAKDKRPYIIVFDGLKVFDEALKSKEMRMYDESGKILKYVRAPQNYAYVAVRDEEL